MFYRKIDAFDAGEVEEKIEKRTKVGDDRTKRGDPISRGDFGRVAPRDAGKINRKR
jgi:hypothetical protein